MKINKYYVRFSSHWLFKGALIAILGTAVNVKIIVHL